MQLCLKSGMVVWIQIVNAPQVYNPQINLECHLKSFKVVTNDSIASFHLQCVQVLFYMVMVKCGKENKNIQYSIRWLCLLQVIPKLPLCFTKFTHRKWSRFGDSQVRVSASSRIAVQKKVDCAEHGQCLLNIIYLVFFLNTVQMLDGNLNV